MLGFSWKRFLVTLGVSVVIWYLTVIIQGISGVNAPFNTLFTSSNCKLTGFPIAECISSGPEEISVWLINIINIIIWFWLLHFAWNFFEKRSK